MARRITSQQPASNYSEAKFAQALDRRMLKKAPPKFFCGNRSQEERVFTEDELNENARIWFREFEEQIGFYEKLGHDVHWVLDWTKKWWWAWLVRDLDAVAELCTQDVTYKDPVSFGKTMVGLQEFIDYNIAFFDAIPDWRYDPLPGQSFLQINPDGTVQMMVRYLGTGHWDGPLKVYPFDETAESLPGNGAFMQCSAVDRYYWNADGMLYRGETIWDAFEGLQGAGVFPKAGSLQFKLLMKVLEVPNTAARLRRSLTGIQ
ncbi:nuclear transport factor 2 family protein [Nocardia aurantiaca]|nr:nuclear transport factor 2 family protein [Nocardia aurantiaca]